DSIKPSKSTRKISMSCSTICATLLKTSRNSRRRSRLAPIRSSALAVLANTRQENNNEAEAYSSGCHPISRNPEWLRRCPAKEVLSAQRSWRKHFGNGSGSLLCHPAARPHHHLEPVSRRPHRLYLRGPSHGRLRISPVGRAAVRINQRCPAAG